MIKRIFLSLMGLAIFIIIVNLTIVQGDANENNLEQLQVKSIGVYKVTLISYEQSIMTLSIKNTSNQQVIYKKEGSGICNKQATVKELTFSLTDSLTIKVHDGWCLSLFEKERQNDQIIIKPSGSLSPETAFR